MGPVQDRVSLVPRPVYSIPVGIGLVPGRALCGVGVNPRVGGCGRGIRFEGLLRG